MKRSTDFNPGNLLSPAQASLEPEASDLSPLLSEPFASAWQRPLPAAAGGLRSRLLDRLRTSKAADAGMVTARRRSQAAVLLAPGVRAQTLYLAQTGRPLRPGEPWRARLIDFAPGAQWDPAVLAAGAVPAGHHREWLLLSGSAMMGPHALSQRDYAVTPAGQPTPFWSSAAGATIFLRESEQGAVGSDAPCIVRDAEAGWPDYAPGVQRRVLWHHQGQAAMLYHARAGAQVPHHRHGHDEECLMLEGELFLNDLLLQPGDYQLAPAGSAHHTTETDTGVVIYAHGDVDLQFVA